MRRIKNQKLAQLLMQLRFTPEKKRRKQLASAEKLFAIIEEDKEYPFEFIYFRITGFVPKAEVEQELVKGEELLNDLEIFISRLSSKLAEPATEQREKIYTIEELAKTLNVSRKTIDRWRKQGLIAKKYIFNDGIKRFGFVQSTVDKFVSKNLGHISKAKSFKRLTNKEKQKIIRQASSLAAKTTLSRYQIIDQIASKIGTVHETVRYILLNYEKTHPEKPIFKKTSGVLRPEQAAELHRLHEQGTSIAELVDRFDRDRSSIYRIINQQRAKALLARKIDFIASDEFLKEGAKEKILNKPISIERPKASKRIEPFELLGEHLLPEYLQILKDTPVLSGEQEHELFRRYNFLKFLALKTRSKIQLSHVLSRQLREVESYLVEAEEIKKMIVEANLRLVVSVASKHATAGTSFAELVSKGNFALIKAVEEFDYTKGFRFSRRASLNIAKEYARVSGKETELTRKKVASLAGIQRDLRSTAAANIGEIERARQNLTQVITDELNEREQYIILNHFGLIGTGVKKQKKTFKQIGDDLGLSKERIRQIELVALQKLRQCLSSREFELLTG